jgi:hypothetical protein
MIFICTVCEDSLDTSQRTEVPPSKRPVIKLRVIKQLIFFVRAVRKIHKYTVRAKCKLSSKPGVTRNYHSVLKS